MQTKQELNKIIKLDSWIKLWKNKKAKLLFSSKQCWLEYKETKIIGVIYCIIRAEIMNLHNFLNTFIKFGIITWLFVEDAVRYTVTEAQTE